MHSSTLTATKLRPLGRAAFGFSKFLLLYLIYYAFALTDGVACLNILFDDMMYYTIVGISSVNWNFSPDYAANALIVMINSKEAFRSKMNTQNWGNFEEEKMIPKNG